MANESSVPSPGQAATITAPADMARRLRAACPQEATDVAMAAHDRACWDYDEGRTLYWERVVNILSEEAQNVDQAAA